MVSQVSTCFFVMLYSARNQAVLYTRCNYSLLLFIITHSIIITIIFYLIIFNRTSLEIRNFFKCFDYRFGACPSFPIGDLFIHLSSSIVMLGFHMRWYCFGRLVSVSSISAIYILAGSCCSNMLSNNLYVRRLFHFLQF